MTPKELRDICEKATAGKWDWEPSYFQDEDGFINLRTANGEAVLGTCDGCSIIENNPDARFIATFNPDRVKRLLDALECAEEALEELEIPYLSTAPKQMPRFNEVIIREALTKIKELMGD